MNRTISETVAVLAVVNPMDGATTARSTGWVDTANWGRIAGIALAGAITGTFDAKLQQATSAAGAGAKDVTGKAITQFTATDDDKQGIINCRPEELDFVNGFRFVRLTLTPTGGTTNLLCGLLVGTNPRYGVASANDATSVAQIV